MVVGFFILFFSLFFFLLLIVSFLNHATCPYSLPILFAGSSFHHVLRHGYYFYFVGCLFLSYVLFYGPSLRLAWLGPPSACAPLPRAFGVLLQFALTFGFICFALHILSVHCFSVGSSVCTMLVF